MLPSDLLRTRTRRGKITPLFCITTKGGGEYELAHEIITYFADMQKSGQTKSVMLEKITALESQHDYKLVRGLYTLLERRAVFGVSLSSALPDTINPVTIRQKLFAESASKGLALSSSQRKNIMQVTAERMHLSLEQIEEMMWGDKDENLILEQFDPISTKDLILWYNQSLVQTLLFRCTTLRFYIKGGLYWKQVLRNVKRYGLMYTLEYQRDRNDQDSIMCVLEGPFSLFRMTDRYGTSLAKLLPSIIETPVWRINGSIIKRTDDGQKIYQFDLSNENTQGFFRAIHETDYNKDGNAQNSHIYDSALESAFAKKFYQHFDRNDVLEWRLLREPDPLIADNKAMIPDFLFERFGRKVYLEIVGFWTKDYLDRKSAKLKALFDGQDRTGVDLLVAVNSELACSQIERISADRVFTFKKEVSIKPILEHLRKIDREIIKEKIRDTEITLDKLHGNLDVISIKKISDQYGIPKEAASQILAKRYPEHIASNLYLISKAKVEIIKDSLKGVSRFLKACDVLVDHEIPKPCHPDLLSKLGYDIIWKDLDPNNAEITLKRD